MLRSDAGVSVGSDFKRIVGFSLHCSKKNLAMLHCGIHIVLTLRKAGVGPVRQKDL